MLSLTRGQILKHNVRLFSGASRAPVQAMSTLGVGACIALHDNVQTPRRTHATMQHPSKMPQRVQRFMQCAIYVVLYFL